MDGSCIYYCMTVIFAAGSTGQNISLAQQLKIGIVGAAITCGAAPIPGGMIVRPRAV